jgi:predicted O-methyltransferase YrrM
MGIVTHSDVLLEILKERRHEIGCEVGVHTGDTTLTLLKNLPRIKRYYAVDPWESYEKYDGEMYRKPGHKKVKTWDQAKEIFLFKIKPYKQKVKVYQMTSVEAIEFIKDEILDWVFIDANHDYPYVKENLYLWSKKVKPGGIISGHDYGGKWKGVKKAVDEFINKDKLHIEDFYVWWTIK